MRAGQTQWATPASSTQEAPNSQCSSAQVIGVMGSGVGIKIPANSGTPILGTGSPNVSSSPCPHLLHSQYGLGLDHVDTAHTWDQPHQAYRNTVQSSAHSHLSRHPEGHSYRLGEWEKRIYGLYLHRFPYLPQSPTRNCSDQDMSSAGVARQECSEPHYSRVQPLCPSVTMPRKFQKPGSQRSHLRPPTPGRQEHWPVAGSQVPL